MQKRNQIISAISPLTPTSIIDAQTGNHVSLDTLNNKIEKVINTVFDETIRLYKIHQEYLSVLLVNYKGSPQAADYARQNRITTNFLEILPSDVKAKSRLQKLVQFKLISETSSYINNPNPDKQEHKFNRTINLGAIDKNMATLSQDDTELNLLWKCWDREYYITFKIPNYVLKRNINKFSMPVIKLNQKTGQHEFIFKIFENTTLRKSKSHIIGIDLGKIKLYSLAVVNSNGQRVASYEASPRLNKASRKRDRLIAENKHIWNKIENRRIRGMASPNQELELERNRSKTSRITKNLAQQMGAEITIKLAKHNANLIKVEDLSWLSGSKKSKIGSSRWSHSQQQEAIAHSTSRIGYKTRTVSPKNTSQICHKCKTKITHRSNRTVWCKECKSSLDRDFNAAMNIAKKQLFPASKKLNGGITGNSGVTIIDSKEASIGLISPMFSKINIGAT